MYPLLLGFGLVCTWIAFLLTDVRGELSMAQIGLLCGLFITLLVQFKEILRPQIAPSLFCFCLYLIFGFFIPALHHVSTGFFPFYGLSYPVEVKNTGSVVVLVAIFFVFGGYYLTRLNRSSGTNMAAKRFLSEPAFRLRYTCVVLVCIALSLLSIAAIGVDAFTTSRGEALGELQASPLEALGQALARSCSFIAFVYSFAMLLRKGGLLIMASCILTAALFLFANNVEATARFFFVAYTFTLWFVFLSTKAVVRFAVFAATPLLAFVILPVLGNIARGDVVGLIDLSWLEYWLSHGDFDGFQSVLNVVDMVGSLGFGLGRYILSAVFVFIPRAYWPEKSPGLGVDAAEYIGYPFTNISSPLPAEFFADFGYAGLVVLSMAYGRLLAIMDSGYLRRKAENDLHGMLPYAIFAGFQFIIVRGSLVGVLAPVALTVGLALLANLTLNARPFFQSSRG